MRAFAWLLLLAVGCGPARVGGQIDGQRVDGARDAIWDAFDNNIPFFGNFDVTVVILTDFPDACDIYDAFYDTNADDCDELCDDYAAIVADYGLRSEGYWSTVLVLNTSDGTEGLFDHDRDLGDEEFVASFNDYDTRPLYDHGACEDACKDGDLLKPDQEDSEDGTLEIVFADNEILRGRFETDFGGDDAISGAFTARRCDMDDFLSPGWW